MSFDNRPRYSWSTANVGVNHQSIKQFIKSNVLCKILHLCDYLVIFFCKFLFLYIKMGLCFIMRAILFVFNLFYHLAGNKSLLLLSFILSFKFVKVRRRYTWIYWFSLRFVLVGILYQSAIVFTWIANAN